MEVPWCQAGHRSGSGHGKGLACNMIYTVMYRIGVIIMRTILYKCEQSVPDPVCPSKIYVIIYE